MHLSPRKVIAATALAVWSFAAVVAQASDASSIGLPADLRARVDAAIAAYEPFPQQRDRALSGLTIFIDASGGSDAEQSVGCARRLQQTAGYLFHFIKQRGGRVRWHRAPGDTTPVAPTRNAIDQTDKRGESRVVAMTLFCPHTNDLAEPHHAIGPGSVDLRDRLADALAGSYVQTALPFQAGRANSVRASCAVWLPAKASGDLDAWLQARSDARALCNGLAAHARSGRPPVNEVDWVELPGESRARLLARRIWPAGSLPADRRVWFIDELLRRAVSNPSLVFADLEVPSSTGRVELAGATLGPVPAKAVAAGLAEVGLEVDRGAVRILPDRSRLGESAHGFCQVGAALTRARPADRAGLQTQLLLGEPVFLLDVQDGFLLLQGHDGYWGWVREGAIARLTEDKFTDYLHKPVATVLTDVTREGKLLIPRGARVRWEKGESTDSVQVIAGHERRIAVSRTALRFEPAYDQARAARRVAAALQYLHTPYVFGGRSPGGLDCSGLMTQVAALAGDGPVARDAAQQVLAGRMTATAWYRRGMQAGDQVFFIDQSGKVYHTGIAISPTHILHAAPPGVQIGSIKPGDRLYDERLDRDFFVAKRP
jgi:hypothetical protein